MMYNQCNAECFWLYICPSVSLERNRYELLAVRFPVLFPCTRIEWCGTCGFTAHINCVILHNSILSQTSEFGEENDRAGSI